MVKKEKNKNKKEERKKKKEKRQRKKGLKKMGERGLRVIQSTISRDANYGYS